MYAGGMCVLDVLFPDGSPAEVWDLRGIIFCRESFSDGISLNTLKLCFQSANITKCLCGCCGFGMLKAQFKHWTKFNRESVFIKEVLGSFRLRSLCFSSLRAATLPRLFSNLIYFCLFLQVSVEIPQLMTEAYPVPLCLILILSTTPLFSPLHPRFDNPSFFLSL